jgi:AcrR family transcriptional regulator
MAVIHETAPPTARSRAATRERLVASATALFATRGLHRVTSHDVARDAGVAAGTFYLHFRDKRAVLREIVFEGLEELENRLDATTLAAEGDVEAAVHNRAEELLLFAEENRNFVRILFGRRQEAADVGADVLERLAESSERVWRVRIESGNAHGDLHPMVVAEALVGMLSRVVAWWAEDPGCAPREDVVRTLTQLQLRGAYPRTSTPQP